MFYIKFNGYKKDKEECAGLFFVGRTYTCNVVDSNRYYQTQDENGNIVKFKSIFCDACYDFSIISTDSEVDSLSPGKCSHDSNLHIQMSGPNKMKAKFIAKSRYYNMGYEFTVGEYYELSHQGGNFYSTMDNNGTYAYFENGRDYKFEISETEPKDRELTYTMNGISVSKSFFEGKLHEVELLKSRGVAVFIDFEVSFE